MPTMAQAFKVVGKAHRRVTTVETVALAPDGTRLTISQNGPMETFYPGDVIEDLNHHELAAFSDRFQAATQAEIDAYREKKRQEQMVLMAPGLSQAQVEEDATLQRQIEELQAKRQALHDVATTPVPVDYAAPAAGVATGRAMPTPTHEPQAPQAPASQGEAGQPRRPPGRSGATGEGSA